MVVQYGVKHAWSIVQVVPEFPQVHVVFADGIRHTFDLTDTMALPAFDKLSDPTFFDAVGIVNGALTWPNEADIAPDMLYEQATGRSGWKH